MLTVEYKGVAVPVLWHLLAKKGNSNQLERIELLKEFISLFGKGRIKNLLADREFIGEKWIQYLYANEIQFTIRVKHNMIVEDKQTWCKLSEMFTSSQTQFYENQPLFGLKLNISGKKRVQKNDHMIIVTNGNAVENLEQYRRRWKIETMFSCLKTRGFNLEDTHMTKMSKIKILVGLLAIAYVVTLLVGIQKEKYEPIKVKSHGRKAMSLFRYGLDPIRVAICDTKNQYQLVQSQIDCVIRQFCLILTLKMR